MALVSREVGSGGDYLTLALWDADRRGASIAGDTEEAVLLDTPNTESFTASSANWADEVTLLIRPQTPHGGNTSAGVIKTSGTWTFAWNSTTKGFHVELRDLHFDISSVGAFARMVSMGPSGSGVVNRSIKWTRPIASGGNTGSHRAMFLVCDSSGQTSAFDIDIVEPLVFDSDDSAFIFGGSQPLTMNISLTGGTFNNSFLGLHRNAAHTWNIDVVGTLFNTVSGVAEIASVSSSLGTLNASSERVISSRTQAQHEAVFGTRTGNTYSVTFVSGTPAAGQVGFTSIAGEDFSLVDHANNIAIDYVTSGSMSATDITGATRDATPDCGAFEVVATGTTLTPAPATYEFSTPAATVTRTDHATLAPAPASYQFSRPMPSVTITDHVTLAPAPALYEFSRPDPLVGITDHILLAPTPAFYEFANPVPAVTVGSGITLTPGTAQFEFSRPVSSVTLSDHVTLTPAPARYEFSAPAPLVVAGGLPTVTAGIWSVPVRLAAGDEWMLVATGPAADAPRMRVTMRFRE